MNQPNKSAGHVRVLTHYIFLIHGWIGHPREWQYFEQAIEEKINHDKHLAMKNREKVLHKNACCENRDRIQVHNTISNVDKTADGVAKGGERLASEVQEYIIADISKSHANGDIKLVDSGAYHVTISFCGNSLGGLYARYSLSCTPTYLEYNFTDESGKSSCCCINIHHNVFMALATPHLGLASNFPFKTSRTFEKIAALSMGQTGQDLFFFDDGNGGVKKKKKKKKQSQRKEESPQGDEEEECLLYTMSTDYDSYLHPLAKFRKRVAYVNSFKTDICAHTTTAGFFSSTSTYPHSTSTRLENDHPFVVATSSTEGDDFFLRSKTPSYKSINRKHSVKKQIKVQGLIMSNKLDSLGWTKVFIDSRKMNPIKTYPKVWKSFKSRSTWSDFMETQSQSTQESWKSNYTHTGTEKMAPVIVMNGRFPRSEKSGGESISSFSRSEDDTSSIDNKRIESKDLFKYMTKNERIQVPVGHSMLIANSKDSCCEKLNFNGRPIVDYIVKNLVDDVNTFKLSC